MTTHNDCCMFTASLPGSAESAAASALVLRSSSLRYLTNRRACEGVIYTTLYKLFLRSFSYNTLACSCKCAARVRLTLHAL